MFVTLGGETIGKEEALVRLAAGGGNLQLVWFLLDRIAEAAHKRLCLNGAVEVRMCSVLDHPLTCLV